MIKLENIDKIYDIKVENRKALDNVTLTIEDGEMVAIMGPSGSGKSTLLNIIGCMDNPTSGKYMLDDIVVTESKMSEIQKIRKENISFIFQNFALMEHYTAYENIELPLLANNTPHSERKKIINNLMELLKISDVKNKIPSKMSGGQQQRVAIARALAADGKIILADEPTGALDQATGKEVMNLLKEINKKGKTVIIVTHDIEIAKQTDRIIHICDGHIEDLLED